MAIERHNGTGFRTFIRLTFFTLVVRVGLLNEWPLQGGGFMQIQINTDNNITGREDVVRLVHSSIEGAVGRFGDRITRVEAHLSDTNGHKLKGDDKRCFLEARLAGLQPIAVSQKAATIELAVTAAADKLQRAIERKIGRLQDR
jgi:hypothetical protein